jgi:Tol biopolymer transport system component
MSIPPFHSESHDGTPPPGERLESWKEIAVYLNRSVRTLHRWEKEEGLPVHRQLHKELGSVFAYKSEVDAWSRARSVRTENHRAGAVLIAGSDGSDVSELPRPLNPYPGDSWPTFSPDGTSIALFVTEEGRYGDYWILPLNGGEPRRVTNDFQEGGAPAWTPDGQSLVIRSSRAGSANLWRVSVADRTLERLTSGAGEDFDPTVSPDGRSVLFANVKRTWEVIVQDIGSGRRRTVLAKRTLLLFPRFSPDGRRIALAGRNSRGDTHVFVMDADGSNLRGITEGPGELNVMPQWSGDGETVYFYQVRPTQTFRSVSVSGRALREIAPWSFRQQYQGAVDRRDRMAVYSSVERGALQESRVRDLKTGSETGLPFALYEQRFSRDGRLIAGESRDHELLVCKVRPPRARRGDCRQLTSKAGHGLTTLAWSGDSTRLFFLRHTGHRVWGELTSIGVDGSDETVHGLIGPFEHDFQLSVDVSPRDEAVFARYREGPHELWMAQLH